MENLSLHENITELCELLDIKRDKYNIKNILIQFQRNKIYTVIENPDLLFIKSFIFLGKDIKEYWIENVIEFEKNNRIIEIINYIYITAFNELKTTLKRNRELYPKLRSTYNKIKKFNLLNLEIKKEEDENTIVKKILRRMINI